MIPVLRPYQEAVIDDLRATMRQHQCTVLQLPTGGGKSVIAAFMVASAISRGRRVWLTVHRSYLIDQFRETFERFGIAHGIVAAGHPFNPYAVVQLCSIDTLRNRLDRLSAPDLLLVDEGHHAVSAGWARVIGSVVGAMGRCVLLTATPERLDGRGLGELAGGLVLGPSVASLIAAGHLSKYRAYAPSAPDLSNVRTTAGDYNSADVGAVMDRSVIIGDMVGHWKRYADGLRSVYFCTSVAHSEHVAAAFNAAGINAVHMDAETPALERKLNAKRCARGEISVFTNANLFGEGFDLSSQAGADVAIDCVGMARPTQSLAMYLQQVGRALRPAAGKDRAIILDHASNITAHGLPDDDRNWSLDGRKRTKADANAVPSVKTCASCFAAFRATLRQCPVCGVATEIQAREVEHIDGELSEIDPEAMRAARLREQGMAKSVEDLIRVGRAQGMKHPERWAAHVASARVAKAQRKAEAQYAAYAR